MPREEVLVSRSCLLMREKAALLLELALQGRCLLQLQPQKCLREPFLAKACFGCTLPASMSGYA